ncbi:MAG: hypothetical protein H8D45_09890 [Bacteroidetes bacterium]|nr:hypothetical protein [Bacteroidota bacterium]MBL7105046.1 hypothetical protein [Bacteroidales bacterium]
MLDRRKFIKSVSQGFILSALLGMSGMLIFRKSRKGEECNFEFVCKNCKTLSSCKLPEANDFKEKNKQA